MADKIEHTEPKLRPKALARPLPLSPHTTLHIQTTSLATSNLIFLTTTTTPEATSSLSALGSFVYAMPNVRSFRIFVRLQLLLLQFTVQHDSFPLLPQPRFWLSRLTNHPQRCSAQTPPISTALYKVQSSIDFATRVAHIIATRTQKPTYVGCSVSLPQGSTVEEKVEGMKVAVEGILESLGETNGVS